MLFNALFGYAQTNGKWSQYYLNPFFINPSATASEEKTSVNFSHRSQWVGLSEGSKVTSFNFETPLVFNSVGIGGGFMSDEEFGQKTLTGLLSASYKINMWSGKLHYGMYFGVQQFVQNTDLFVAQNPSDEALTNTSSILPDMGAGLMYRSDKLELFISGKHFIQASIFDNGLMRQNVHYYFGSSYSILKTKKIEVKPIGIFRHVRNLPLQAQLGVVLEKENVFFTGIQMGTAKEVSMNLGLNLAPYIKQEIQLSYAYEWSWSNLADYHQGTHELMIRYNLHKRPDVKSIRKRKPIKQLIDF